MFGISGRFPPVYAGAVMMGQALGGVVPSIAAIALLSFDVEAKILGPACFGAVLILLFLAFLSFQWVKVNKFFLYYAEGKDNHGVVEDHDAQVDDLCYKDIFKRSWTYLISGFLTYATTLSVFPALTNSGSKSSLTVLAKKTARGQSRFKCLLFSGIHDKIGVDEQVLHAGGCGVAFQLERPQWPHFGHPASVAENQQPREVRRPRRVLHEGGLHPFVDVLQCQPSGKASSCPDPLRLHFLLFDLVDGHFCGLLWQPLPHQCAENL